MATTTRPSPQRKRSPDANSGGKSGKSAERGKTPLWELRLYVAGMTSTSIRALDNLKSLCEKHLQGMYKIHVIDLLERPTLASGDQIIAVPTLVRRLPTPVKKIIGDLSNADQVLVGLDLRPAGGKGR
ncbi:MAG TPA: circadian clock KaiB family protein [Candidatus Solibacter sp.]|jgi:circadian clock protein KaiB|nr:circadian clock KaiB family protein [Candidatus Solibacter sp.]